jgi:hypothetical protein
LKYYLVGNKPKQPPVPQNTFTRSEKEKFLDNYFLLRLQKLISKINAPQVNNRKDHVENIFDSLMDIADEYQAVVIEDEEERYWESNELWDDELRQREAVQWVNHNMQEQQTKSLTPPPVI